jgi:hypothetical protein
MKTPSAVSITFDVRKKRRDGGGQCRHERGLGIFFAAGQHCFAPVALIGGWKWLLSGSRDLAVKKRQSKLKAEMPPLEGA